MISGEEIIKHCMSVNGCTECRRTNLRIYSICNECDLSFNFYLESEEYEKVEEQMRMKGFTLNDCEYEAAIDALEKQKALVKELKSMKRNASNYLNQDYATGYMCAISVIEGFISKEE